MQKLPIGIQNLKKIRTQDCIYAEMPSNLGRLDLLVQVSGTTYIIELKLDKILEEGVQQIKERQYYLTYLHQVQRLAIVGLNISFEDRNIASWAAAR